MLSILYKITILTLNIVHFSHWTDMWESMGLVILKILGLSIFLLFNVFHIIVSLFVMSGHGGTHLGTKSPSFPANEVAFWTLIPLRKGPITIGFCIVMIWMIKKKILFPFSTGHTRPLHMVFNVESRMMSTF